MNRFFSCSQMGMLLFSSISNNTALVFSRSLKYDNPLSCSERLIDLIGYCIRFLDSGLQLQIACTPRLDDAEA